MYKKKIKFAFVSFFQVFPSYSGASEVSSGFFNSWPNKNKKFFQLSSKKNIKNKKIFSFKINFENPITKIIKINLMAKEIGKYLYNSKKKIVIFEGASWIGYFYILKKILKKRFPELIVIYHSHNIEYDLRSSKSNFFIIFLTKIIEKNMFLSCDISTVVSKIDYKRVIKLYNIKPYILQNGIKINSLISSRKIKIKLPKKFIFFNGSYSYKPNMFAIDTLIENIMPKVIKKFPNIKLVISGGGYGYHFKNNNLINLGILKKKDLVKIIKKALCLAVPLKHGFGTRVKIIEALMLGCKIISTKKGIEGIDLKYKNSSFKIANNNSHFAKLLINEIKNNNKIKNKSINYYKKKYNMNLIVKKFYNENF